MTEIALLQTRLARMTSAYRSIACMDDREGDRNRARFYRGLARSALADLRLLRSVS